MYSKQQAISKNDKYDVSDGGGFNINCDDCVTEEPTTEEQISDWNYAEEHGTPSSMIVVGRTRTGRWYDGRFWWYDRQIDDALRITTPRSKCDFTSWRESYGMAVKNKSNGKAILPL